MAKPRNFVTRRLLRAVKESLGELFDVAVNNADRALDTAELTEAIMTVDAALPTVTDRISQWKNRSEQRHVFTG